MDTSCSLAETTSACGNFHSHLHGEEIGAQAEPPGADVSTHSAQACVQRGQLSMVRQQVGMWPIPVLADLMPDSLKGLQQHSGCLNMPLLNNN